MKRIYYEMKREEWNKPFVRVEVFYPDAQEYPDMPALIHITSGHFERDADTIDTSEWLTYEGSLYKYEAGAIRRAIELIDNVYESLMKGEKSG